MGNRATYFPHPLEAMFISQIDTHWANLKYSHLIMLVLMLELFHHVRDSNGDRACGTRICVFCK